MSYSDFDLRKVQTDFNLTINEGRFFPEIKPVPPDQRLQETLEENLPLVLARGKEKGRSEWIISPVLTGVRRLLKQKISLFSGDDFNVDPARGLNGRVDFIISRSPKLLLIESPVVTIVEAKKEDLNGGLGQCVAEMLAAQLFNIDQGNPISCVYGCVSTGTAWKFLRLENTTVTIDLSEYPLPPVDQILGFLIWMVEEG
jgi:hypothetical protein